MEGGRERLEDNEDMSVFKSYLRRLLQDLKDLQKAHESGKTKEVEEMIQKLIEDTQKGLED